jgi:hypothetical protein
MTSLTFICRETYGRLFAYDKSYDRITTKTEKPLQLVDRIKYNTTTSDDPVIQQVKIMFVQVLNVRLTVVYRKLASKNTATVYTTDVILSVLMCAPRSVYPWDIVIVREGNNLFFDKRDGGPFDTVTVNENASDPPTDPAPPNPNNPAEKVAVPEPLQSTPLLRFPSRLPTSIKTSGSNLSLRNRLPPRSILLIPTRSMGLMKPSLSHRVATATASLIWV